MIGVWNTCNVLDRKTKKLEADVGVSGFLVRSEQRRFFF